ncbi:MULTISPECIES: DUF1818 family protein [Aphanothece]|uniref:DUF1818 family protein n=1 Tax=Aphanothece TaxID=1121 RepID=UPI003984933F
MEVQEGPGWRLVVDPQRQPFPVLIGGEAWAAEWTASEAITLRRGLLQLLDQLKQLADQLMPEESITLEAELPCPPGDLWMELEGRPSAWQLRFVLTPGPTRRALEGAWGLDASWAMVAALEQCPLLDQLAAGA